MLRQKRARILIGLVILVTAIFWRGWRAHRQATLDRALIAAVTKDDAATTATLLAAGADPNAKEWQAREAHGWLERAQHLLAGKFYEPNPAPVLAIAMRRGNNANIRILKRRGADVDAARRYWLDVFMQGTGEDAAITNGIRLLHEMDYSTPSDSLMEAKTWVGKRVAFDVGGHMPPRIIVADGVTLEVEFPPSAPWPIVTGSCLVGTIKSVDMKRKIIYIRSKVQEYHIFFYG
jgi:hypothetical protein